MISVTCLFFVHYLPHLVTSLCQCGVQLAHMGWAGFPSVPGFAQVLHRTRPPPGPRWRLASLPHPLQAPDSVLWQQPWPSYWLRWIFGLTHYSLVVLYCLMLHEMDTTTPRIFSKACPNHFPFFPKQLVSVRMQRLRDSWYSTTLIPTIVAIEDGLLSMRLCPEMTWRLLISLWKGVPR